MIITNKVIFVENPKTSSHYIRKLLIKKAGGFSSGCIFDPAWERQRLLTFTVVRNPYQRIMSLYLASGQGYRDLREWLSLGECYNDLLQSYWTKNCDKVLRYENLEGDFNRLMFQVGLSLKFKPNYKEDHPLTAKEKDIIYTKFKKDFEDFDYGR